MALTNKQKKLLKKNLIQDLLYFFEKDSDICLVPYTDIFNCCKSNKRLENIL
jgi:hypothetical protein